MLPRFTDTDPASSQSFGVEQFRTQNGHEFLVCSNCPKATEKTPVFHTDRTSGTAPVSSTTKVAHPASAKPKASVPGPVVEPGQTLVHAVARIAEILQPIATVFFPFNSSFLSGVEQSKLRTVIASIASEQVTKLREISISAYTDNTGPDRYNDWLANRRAETVKRLVIKYLGLSQETKPIRITASGKGHCCYAADNSTEDGRAKNRRAEVVLHFSDNDKESSP